MIFGPIGYQVFFWLERRGGNVGLLLILVPLLMSWSSFRTPLTACWSKQSYWSTLPKTLLTEPVSTLLVLAGAMPVLISLEALFGPYNLQSSHPLVWVPFLLAAVAGGLVVFPFNLWMAQRGFQVWSFYFPDREITFPRMRNAWGALLISLAAMVVVIASLG